MNTKVRKFTILTRSAEEMGAYEITVKEGCNFFLKPSKCANQAPSYLRTKLAALKDLEEEGVKIEIGQNKSICLDYLELRDLFVLLKAWDSESDDPVRFTKAKEMVRI